MCVCIPINLRETRKKFNKFFFTSELMSFKSPGREFLHPPPRLLDLAQIVLDIPKAIFPRASIHWNISLGESILANWFVPKKPSGLTDSVH